MSGFAVQGVPALRRFVVVSADFLHIRNEAMGNDGCVIAVCLRRSPGWAAVLVGFGLLLAACSSSSPPASEAGGGPWFGATHDLFNAVHVWHRVEPGVVREHASGELLYEVLVDEPLLSGDPSTNTLAGQVEMVSVPSYWSELSSDSPTILVGILQAESSGAAELGLAVTFDARSISLFPVSELSHEAEKAIIALAEQRRSQVDHYFVESLESDPTRLVEEIWTQIRAERDGTES